MLNFKRTKRVTLFVAIIFSVCMNFSQWYSTYTFKKEVLSHHEQIFSNIRLLSSLNTHNIDLLMREGHYINKHKDGHEVPVCPECADGGEGSYAWPEVVPIEGDPVGNTFEQIRSDIQAIDIILESLVKGEQGQTHSLMLHLEKLKGKMPIFNK